MAQLFAGGTVGGTNGMGFTYASPIHAVLNALKVDLFTGWAGVGIAGRRVARPP